MELQPAADHVWVYPYDPDADIAQPMVGAVITASETVLIDAGNSPYHARQVRAALQQHGAPPVKYVIYTHHHFDHTFGAQIWRDSVIVGHMQCRAQLQDRFAGRSWNPRYVEEQIYQHPAQADGLRMIEKAVGDWQTFQLRLPHITFSDDLRLMLDGVTLALRHVGGQHASDSITVTVEESQVMFIGDCYYPPPMSVRQPDDKLDYAMIDRLLDQNAALYCEGHNIPFARADFAARFVER
jgi:glyoxylase-like metal-dependent hydrolase (beta-lactamase superfamily II)